MFPLYTKVLPSTATELAQRLNASLARLFAGISDPVSIRGDAYPQIVELRVSLDGATLRKVPPPKLRDSSKPALTIDNLRLQGSEVNVGPVSLDLDLAAESVRLDEGRDADDEI